MSEEVAPVVVVAIEISDPALADRLASLLGGVTGIRLATPGEAAAVALVSREAQSLPRTWLTSSLRRANATCWC